MTKINTKKLKEDKIEQVVWDFETKYGNCFQPFGEKLDEFKQDLRKALHQKELSVIEKNERRGNYKSISVGQRFNGRVYIKVDESILLEFDNVEKWERFKRHISSLKLL